MKILTILTGILNIGLLTIILIAKNEDNSSIKSAVKTTAPIAELWQVDRISDGDTITVSKKSDRRRVRFCGIDAPESSQPGGKEAKQKLEELIEREEVSIAFVEQDRYGRWIGEIFANPGSDREIFINEELVRLGLVWPYKQYWENCPNRDAIAAAEAIAVNPIWEQPGNTPPWEWRRKKK